MACMCNLMLIHSKGIGWLGKVCKITFNGVYRMMGVGCLIEIMWGCVEYCFNGEIIIKNIMWGLF